MIHAVYMHVLLYGLILSAYVAIAVAFISIVAAVAMIFKTVRNERLTRRQKLFWIIGQVLICPLSLLYMILVERGRWWKLVGVITLVGYGFVLA